MTPLRSYVRVRLVLLAVSIGVIAGLSVWAVWTSGLRVDELRSRLTAAHLASYRLADGFQQRLLALNNLMLRFTVRHDPATWSEFERASNELDRWIQEQSPGLSTDREREEFQQLHAAYESYLQAARQVNEGQPQVTTAADALEEMKDFEGQADHLLDLGQQLADAHRVAREAFLEQTDAELSRLRGMLFAAVGLSLALMGALGWFAYRDLIGPLQVRLVQSEDLLVRQEKLATLGTLAAGIAHEIRNPLTSINARLYTLSKHIKDNDAGLSDAAIISDEIARLERIVQDVLRFARPSEPQLQTVRADVPLHEVHKLMAAVLENNRIRLAVESRTEQLVSIDVSLIKQVLVNLVRNATEAIDQEGTITLRASAGRSKLKDRIQDVAILEVSDTGKGIPPEVEQRLFDPFFSTKEAGTGLGLAIAARIVEKHGGALQYQTQVGRGTTFGILLPIASGETGNSPPG